MHQARERTAPFIAPDSPNWRADLTVRRNPYRYLDHQRGIIGVLKVRLIEGTNLDRGLEQSKSVSPQVIIKVADEISKSSVAQHNRSPSWRERFTFEIRKGSLQEGTPVLVVLQVIDASWKALSKPRVLGTGSLDILALLNGSRGSHVIDDWVELSPGGGSVHVVVEYESHGIEPQVGDVVFFEAFARSQRSLVFPVNEPMIVRAVSGAYLLVAFMTKTAREGDHSEESHPQPETRVKVHRNTVFVIERLTLFDSAWHHVLDATDVLQTIPPVSWTKKKLQPYAKYILVMARPALASMSIAYAAAKIAARTSIAAMSGATMTFFQDEDTHFSN